MCGIVGFFGEGNKQLIQKMTDAFIEVLTIRILC